ncbi:bacteriocin secretion accessory protein [Lactococcus lactis]|uniref:bacteriocin secretion accessory protein n=1 Tax=Lactococcus lactis TaxID=1358 RepID=UPI00117BCB9C|nr:bacteriocin secretion accessory protein [Lactococcus lactis]TRW73858.1 bacteriocin secretion accessory protein [Lactococcus lactis]
MNHHNWQNSSQVYTQSHKHFYRWMTYPTLFLFLFILSFLFLGKKEMIIKSQGQLTSTIVSKIQIPIEGKVLENKLSENLAVKKGETLVKLDLESFKKNKEALEQEIPLIENKIKSAETFIESLNKGTSQFTSDDEFGYKNQLESLLAENSANDASLNQSIETHKNEQATYENTKKSIALSIYKKKEERRNWQDIRSAWTSQSNITNFPTEITAQYTTFQNQLKTSSKEEKEQVKSTVASTINEKIEQIQKEIDQLEMDQSRLTPPVPYSNEISNQGYKKKQSIEQAIAETKQKVIGLKESLKKNNIELSELKNQIKNEVIASPISGFVHVNDNFKEQKLIPKGEVIAEIYPEINDKEIQFTSQIQASDLTQVKTGMKVHFKLDSKGNDPIMMDGKIDEIAVNATNSERGTFYLIKGTLKQSNHVHFNSRYGLSGRLSLIVGKKTYFNVLKDIILKK